MSFRATAALSLILLLSSSPAAMSGTGAPCGDLDYQGHCKDGRVQWCEDDELHETDCAQLGRACGWDEARGFFQCVPQPGPEGACPDDLGWSGRCEADDRVVWCQDGAVQALDCSAGSRCGWNPEGFYDCVAGEGQGNYGDEPAGSGAPDEQPKDLAKPAPKEPAPPKGKPPTQTDAPDADEASLEPAQTISTQPATGCGAAAPGGIGLLWLALFGVARRSLA